MDPHLHRRMSSSNPFASLFPGSSQDSEHSEPPEPSLNDQLEEIFSFTLNEKISHTKDVSILSSFKLVSRNKTSVRALHMLANISGSLFRGSKQGLRHNSPENGQH